MPYTMIDFFAGIGGFTLGFEAAGAECIGHCEIDKFAQKSYRAIHGENERWFADDIKRVRPEDVPKCDIITAGFPCQDISVSGKGAGLGGERSSLFFEIIRIIKGKKREDKPRWIVLENVKNLLHIAGGRDFTSVLYTLAEVGYDVEYQILNSKNHGVPQNRERVYIIGHLRGRSTQKIFPVPGTDGADIIQIVGGTQGHRIYDSRGVAVTQTAEGGGMGGKTGLYTVSCNRRDGIRAEIDTAHCLLASGDKGIFQNQYTNAVVMNIAERNAGFSDLKAQESGVTYSPCAMLTPHRENKRQNGRRVKEPEEPMFTLTTIDRHGVLLIREATKKGYAEAGPGDSVDLSQPNSKTRRGRVGKQIANTLDTACNKAIVTEMFRIRRLTPRECWRLQGISDEIFDRAREVCSDSQLYRQAGNGVTVTVVYEIARRLI